MPSPDAPPVPARPVELAPIIDDLAYQFDGVFTRDQVTAAVTDARDLLEPPSKIATFLPILITRHAKEQLTATAQAAGLVAKTVPEILFVCVHNAGRSQMAAAIAAHLAPGKVHVRSAGSHPTGQVNPVAVDALHERGIDLTEAYPKPLSDSVLHAADVIITMGCGDACPVYAGKRYEDWDVADPDGQPLPVLRDIRDDLTTRVGPCCANSTSNPSCPCTSRDLPVLKGQRPCTWLPSAAPTPVSPPRCAPANSTPPPT